MATLKRPCLDCGTLTPRARCPVCATRISTQRANARPPRPHYGGDYRKRAAQVRANATHCWICGRGQIESDPWQADHLQPGNPDSPLLAAHRSCNAARGNKW